MPHPDAQLLHALQVVVCSRVMERETEFMFYVLETPRLSENEDARVCRGGDVCVRDLRDESLHDALRLATPPDYRFVAFPVADATGGDGSFGVIFKVRLSSRDLASPSQSAA